jgi:hypothetical protein
MNIGLLKSWFPFYGLLEIKENVQSFHTDFPCKHCRRQTYGIVLSFSLLTGVVYQHFLRNVLPELLQEVDLQTRIHLWFMREGVPPHFILEFREFLKNVFPEQWIGRSGSRA